MAESTATDVALLDDPARTRSTPLYPATELPPIEVTHVEHRAATADSHLSAASSSSSLSRIHRQLAQSGSLTWMLSGDSLEPHHAPHREWRSFGGRLGEFVRTELGRNEDVFIVNATPGQCVETIDVESRIFRYRPDFVLFSLGPGEAAHGTSGLLAFEQSLGRLLVRLADAGIVAVLCTPPLTPVDEAEDSVDRLIYVEAIRAIAAEYDVPLVDHFAHWETAATEIGGLERWFEGESTSPGRVGHEQLTRRIILDLQLDQVVVIG